MLRYCENCKKDVTLVTEKESNAKICSICGSVIIPSSDQLPSGTIINGFLIEEKIGCGGMGVVYRAKQLNLERDVAFKVLSNELSVNNEFIDRFFREARSAANLNHPNIVQVYDAGSTPDGIYYFAMELMEGETLEARIQRDGCLSPKDALNIAGKIAHALKYAWEKQQLCHGDIKPENIILNSSGGAKLADLGLAKSMHDDKAYKDGIMATPLYAPPEVIAGELYRIDCRSDMYSFGATLYNMLSGAPPFLGDDPEEVMNSHLNKQPVPLKELNRELNPAISDLIDRLLAKNPEERPESWKEVAKAIGKIHDVERKVFYKAAIHDADSSELLPSLTEEDSFGWFIKLFKYLAATVFLMLIFIGVYYLGFKRSSELNAPANVGESYLRLQKINEEWQALKNAISSKSARNAVDEIQKFIAKYENDAPPEAGQILEIQKQKLNADVKRKEDLKKQKEWFHKEMETVLKIIAAKTMEDKPIGDLQEFVKRIDSLLELAANKKDYLFIPPDKREKLNEASLKIAKRIVELQNEEELKRLEELAKQEQERRALEQKKREEEEKIRQENLAVNALIDKYYVILADFLAVPSTKRNLPRLSEDLKTLHRSAENIPGHLSVRIEFIQKTVIPSSLSFVSVFQKNGELLKGKSIPGDVAPQGYKIEEISDTSIKLVDVINKEKGKIYKIVYWKQLRLEDAVEFLKDRIIDAGIKLDKSDRNAILAFLLVNNLFSDFLEILKSFSLSSSDSQIWESICSDFQHALREKQVIETWASFSEEMKNNEPLKASKWLGNIVFESTDTLFFKRYSEEISRWNTTLKWINPELQASIILNKAASDLAESNYTGALNKIMVAGARCACLKDLNPRLKEKISFMQVQILSKLRQASRISEITDNRIPFYYWEADPPGDAWIYNQIVRENGILNRRIEILKAMDIAASLDNGNWGYANEIFQQNQASNIRRLSNLTGRIRYWAPSFIFAQALLNLRYNDGDARVASMSALRDISLSYDDSSPMRAMTANLAMEYALMGHTAIAVIDLSNNYHFGFSNFLEFKVALLHLLALLQKPDISLDEFSGLVKYYEDNYKNRLENFDRVSSDFDWCHVAGTILDGTRDLNDKELNSLRDARCSNPDICARIITAAMARSFLMGFPCKYEREIYGILQPKISGNLVSGELWKKLAVLRIARRRNPESLFLLIDEYLDDNRICTIDFYPQLCMLKAGLDIMSKKDTPQEAQNTLARLLGASSVASGAEKYAVRVLTSSSPVDPVSELTLKNVPGTAYWCGILGIMAHLEDAKLAMPIAEQLNENYHIFSWEERLLLAVLRWRISNN